MDINMTRHAEVRMAQRGIQSPHIDLLFQFGDLEVPCGKGGTSLAMTKTAYQKMLKKGISVQLADKARNLVAVIGSNGAIITVLHNYGQQGSHYTRDKRTSRCYASRRTGSRKRNLIYCTWRPSQH